VDDLKIKVPQIIKYEFKIFGFIPIFSRTTTTIIKFDYTEIAGRIAEDMKEALEKRLNNK